MSIIGNSELYVGGTLKMIIQSYLHTVKPKIFKWCWFHRFWSTHKNLAVKSYVLQYNLMQYFVIHKNFIHKVTKFAIPQKF